MLIEFRFENYRSFRDATAISMLPVNSYGERPENVHEASVPGTGTRGVLTAAAVYGGNASGKTNLLRAVITEPGLYSAILGSRKPEAKAFQRWVTHEVLPALRRDGGYMVARADETPEELMARALKAADATLARVRDENARLTRRNQVLEPKAAFFDSVMESDGLISVRAAAKVLKSYDREMGERRLRQMLRDACYLEKRTRSATAAAIGRGYMKERPFAITHSDGRREMDHYGCLTPKGLAMCARRFCGQAALPGMG